LGKRICNPSSDHDHDNYYNHCATTTYNDAATTYNDARCANECVCDKF
jgi:hypothetical protein